jgi:hypothetical protein
MSIAAGAYVTEGIFFFVGTGGTTMSKAIDTFISRY